MTFGLRPCKHESHLNNVHRLLHSLDLCPPFRHPNRPLSMSSTMGVWRQVLERIADAAIIHAVDCCPVQPLLWWWRQERGAAKIFLTWFIHWHADWVMCVCDTEDLNSANSSVVILAAVQPNITCPNSNMQKMSILLKESIASHNCWDIVKQICVLMHRVLLLLLWFAWHNNNKIAPLKFNW